MPDCILSTEYSQLGLEGNLYFEASGLKIRNVSGICTWLSGLLQNRLPLCVQIYVEIERARLTKKLAGIKEEEGNIEEAAAIIQEVAVVGYLRLILHAFSLSTSCLGVDILPQRRTSFPLSHANIVCMSSTLSNLMQSVRG